MNTGRVSEPHYANVGEGLGPGRHLPQSLDGAVGVSDGRRGRRADVALIDHLVSEIAEGLDDAGRPVGARAHVAPEPPAVGFSWTAARA